MSRVNRTWDEIAIGDAGELTRVCTADDIVVFVLASGNYSPAHLAPTPEAVAPSMWVGSLFSSVLGNVLPGPGTTYRSQTLRFHGRVHVGDELTIRVTVTDKQADGRLVILDCRLVNQRGELVADGVAEVIAPDHKLKAEDVVLPNLKVMRHDKYRRLIAQARSMGPLDVAVVFPTDEVSLRGAIETAEAGLINPILIGPADTIRALADEEGVTLGDVRIIDAAQAQEAAARAVKLVHEGAARAIMKGNLHTDQLAHEVVRSTGGLRAGRRISHVFILDVPGLDRFLLVTDAVINILPPLETKVDIVQNAIDLALALGVSTPKVGILSAVETVNPQIPSTLDAAALSKMAERGQIKGGLVDGPLAMDNAISTEAARTKGLKSLVAGNADVLVVPNIEAGNMVVKELTFLAGADISGIVVGALVPVIVTSRADNIQSRLASCAVSTLYDAYQKTFKPRKDIAP
ncbi:MAG: bifunctional enoyl-CoA hydratase/phosphate acetyltransferase [Isosphaeraceae bacterium]